MTRLLLLAAAFAAGVLLAVALATEDEPPADSGWRDWAPGADFV